MTFNSTACRRRPRRGITILEVLIAAGVLSIGMFGVLALIPLIALRLQEGDIADRSSTLGRNAVEEFQIRGMSDPTRWTRYDSAGATASGAPGTSSAVLIDPLGVAALHETLNGYQFPAVIHPNAIGAPVMPRVTTVPLTVPATPDNAVDRALSEAVAVSEDDVLIERPESRLDLPRQSYPDVAFGGSPELQSRRMASRNYSWFATLFPLDGSTVGNNGNYLLSVAVFFQRSRNYGIGEEAMGLINGGPAASGGGFLAGGVFGGEVVVQNTPADTTDPEILDIGSGDWVLLSIDPPPIGTAPNIVDELPFHRWYQVIETAPFAPGDTSRRITLSGADWPYWNFLDNSGNPVATQVTWVQGVATVYEKTITVNSNGAWKD